MIRFPLVALLIVMASTQSVVAQRAASPPSAPVTSGAEARAAELRAVVGLVTSPDRDLNIANFEQIVESGDARRIEIAIRTLVASDDSFMRGLAMRGYLVAARDIILEVVLPDAEMKLVEQKRGIADGMRSFQSPNRHLYYLSTVGFHFKHFFDIGSIRSMRGKVTSYPGQSSSAWTTEYAVRGERITYKLLPSPLLSIPCNIELQATRDATITGVMNCPHEDFHRPVQLAAPMF